MEDSTTRSSPVNYSSHLATSETDPLATHQPSSRPSSLQSGSDSVLNSVSESNDSEFGFQRSEMNQLPLAGTVQIYERHVFLCYKNPQVWPSHVEAAEFDRLPRLLTATLKAKKSEMAKKTRLTICEGEDGTESSNGDVLIFPDMIRYRRLTHFDVDNFVEHVLVKETEWLSMSVEQLTGSYIFVCAHGSRDKRCGVCGPALIKKFKDEISVKGIQDQVSVSPCSHIGGHKYAGNVIIFSKHGQGEVMGHWYGYVTPEDVSVLLEQHIGKGEIIDRLWRGQMGLSEEEQKKTQEARLQLNGKKESVTNETVQEMTDDNRNGCCQGNNKNISCCQNGASEANIESNDRESENTVEREGEKESSMGSRGRKLCGMPTWFETWEREDTYAALAVITAAASIAVAYSCYRQSR